MKSLQLFQSALEQGLVPFFLAAGERRGVKVNANQIINALVIAAITAGATGYATLGIVENELKNQRILLDEVRNEVRMLRELTYEIRSARGEK